MNFRLFSTIRHLYRRWAGGNVAVAAMFLMPLVIATGFLADHADRSPREDAGLPGSVVAAADAVERAKADR